MKNITFYFLLLLLTSLQAFSQTKFISWNLENFGKSKSQVSLTFIAKTVQEYDIVAIQEVVAGYGGLRQLQNLLQY